MQHIKNKIKASFDGAADTYDQYAQLQQVQCATLIQKLASFMQYSPAKVLDVGCGTGNSTLHLYHKFSPNKLYAIDFSGKLLEKARQKLARHNIIFIKTDFDQLSVKNNSVDLIFSNMALHWSLSFNNTLRLLIEKLAPRGMLAFSLPLENTFNEINRQHRNTFQSMAQIKEKLLELGGQPLLVKQTNVQTVFSSPIKALRSLKMIGANCLLNQHAKPAVLHTDLKAILGENVNLRKAFHLTYNIGLFVVKKQE